MSFINIIGIAFCGFSVTTLLKQINPAFSVYTSAFTAIILTCFAFRYLEPAIIYLKSEAENSGIDGYAAIIIKLTAIGIITGIAADICADAGENAIAGRIELLGKAVTAMTVLPVLKNIISAVKELLM